MQNSELKLNRIATHLALSLRRAAVAFGAHETGSGGGLSYRIGELPNPPKSYSIKWSSGEYGIRYTGGVLPHIALNNQNQVRTAVTTVLIPAGSSLLYSNDRAVLSPFEA